MKNYLVDEEAFLKKVEERDSICLLVNKTQNLSTNSTQNYT